MSGPLGNSTRQPVRARVEMVLPSMETGGQELLVRRLSVALRDIGFDVGITCTEFEGTLAPHMRADGFDVAMALAPGVRTNFRADALVRRFAARQPDVVHIHNGVWLKAARAARAAAVPRIIHTIHGLMDREPWYGPALMRLAARSTDLIAAVSNPLQQYLTNDVGVDARRVQLILNGVDTREFRPGGNRSALRARLGFPTDGPVLGHVARLAPIKNQSMLLDAFAGVLDRHPGAALIIAGDGPERHRLEHRVATLDMGNSVRFLGEVAETAPLYRDFDVFVLTSHSEGTSVSLLEAMASGVCVVGTAVGGTPALLDGGRCGVLVPPGDTGALITSLSALLFDDARRIAFGQSGRTRAEREYSASVMRDRYVQAYGYACVE